MKTRTQQIEELNKEWTNPRWEGITRPYSAEDVVKAARLGQPGMYSGAAGRGKDVATAARGSEKGYVNSFGRADRRSGAAAGESGH